MLNIGQNCQHIVKTTVFNQKSEFPKLKVFAGTLKQGVFKSLASWAGLEFTLKGVWVQDL